MKYCLSLLCLLLACSCGMLWAKDGKIKVGKYVRYEGGVSDFKIDGERVPEGMGVLSIFHPTDTKEPEVTIRGIFHSWSADSASIVWSNDVSFSGSLKIVNSYEKNVKTEHVEIKCLPGGIITFPKLTYPAKEELPFTVTEEFRSLFSIVERPQMLKVVLPDSVSVEASQCDYSVGGNHVVADLSGRIVSMGNGGFMLMGGPVYGTVETLTGSYTGALAKGELQWAEGTFESTDGLTYKGLFKEGTSFDLGMLTWPNGDWAKGFIAGSQKEIEKARLLNGTCLLHLEEGLYDGSMKDGLFEKGSLTSKNGDYQTGTWGTVDGEHRVTDGTVSIVSKDTLVGTMREGRLWEGTISRTIDSVFYHGKMSEGKLVEGVVRGKCLLDDGKPLTMNVERSGSFMVGTLTYEERYQWPYQFTGVTKRGVICAAAQIVYGPYTVNGIWRDGQCQQAMVTKTTDEGTQVVILPEGEERVFPTILDKLEGVATAATLPGYDLDLKQ